MARCARHALVWAAAGGAVAAVEAHALRAGHDRCTLSAYTRSAFRTHTAAGRVAFIAACAALGAWFGRHILHP